MNRFNITIISVSLSLAACNTIRHGSNFDPEAAEPDQAIIYLYRPGAMSNAIYSPDLYIDNEFKLSIKNGKNTRITLKPGKHLLEIDPDQQYHGKTRLMLDLLAGETTYISVGTSLKISSAVNYEPYKRSFNLIEVDEKSAISQISICCSKKKHDEEIKSVNALNSEDKNSGSFSVDKTQNPFSH